MLCPELVGRDVEVDRLRGRVADLARGRGGVVALVGEAGAGKSRLLGVVGSAADALGIPVLSGRAVPGATPVPYRPLTEAFLATFRTAPRPTGPSLDGFDAHLGRLVPTWASAAAAEESPLLLAEAVVRLLALHGDGTGCVLLLEDLHWADVETVAVLDYLADALRAEPVLCVCTTRPAGGADEVLSRVERRDPEAVVRVDPLGETDIVRMVGACLSTSEPPAGLSGFVRAHSDGNPFLVEELLAGLVAAGELRKGGGRWDVTGPLTPAVPATLRDSIRQRLAILDGDARRVLGAAALLGRQFEWELLPGIAEVDGRAAADALRAAVDEQLIDVDGDGFVFRHALTREAVLADLLPPERRQLAARAWPVVERANPGLPGPSLELAADLAEAAGDRRAAAERLVASARRALDGAGALATAEATARRAQRLAGGDAAAALDADEVLVHVLAAAGKAAEALALGRDVADRMRRADDARTVDHLVVLAQAALVAGELEVADAAVADARAAADPADVALGARLDAVAGNAALDRGHLGEAEALLRRAIAAAATTGQPAVECDALLLLGRAVRGARHGDAVPLFERAAALASEAGLASWHLRASQELALHAWPSGHLGAMHETRALAARYGAHITVAVMDLSFADIALSNFDREGCLASATACVDASARYGLATEAVGQLWLAGAHALGGDDVAMQAAVDAALARDPDDHRILGDLYGRVLTSRAIVRGELDDVLPLADEAMAHVRLAPPHQSIFPGRVYWALLHAIDDEDLGAAVRDEYDAFTRQIGMAIFDRMGVVLQAVALGRTGDADAAAARLASVYDELRSVPLSQGMFHAIALFVARAAHRDGWGDPARWVRDSEAFFVAGGYDVLARRARAMLADLGAPVPRRRGATEVPQGLRALGVTGREVDVLRLVVDGRSNKEIAAALFLSPKTVERHLSSLFARTGVANRRELAEVGEGHFR